MGVLLKKNENVMARVIGDEMILVPVRGELARLQQVFVLNEVGAFIWEHIDGARDREALTAAVVEAFEVEPGTAQADVEAYLAMLSEHELIVSEEPSGR